MHPSIDGHGLRDSELKMGVGKARDRHYPGFFLCPESVRVGHVRDEEEKARSG